MVKNVELFSEVYEKFSGSSCCMW